MSQHQNFSDALSDETSHWLKCAGWTPGKQTLQFGRWKYGKSDHMWNEYCRMFQCQCSQEEEYQRHPARSILSELFGLRVDSPDDVRFRSALLFRVDQAIGLCDETADLSDLVYDFLIPIGELLSEANVLIGASGRVFAAGFVGFGVIYFGETFGEAMERIHRGLPGKPVPLEDTRFHNPELTGDGVWIPLPP